MRYSTAILLSAALLVGCNFTVSEENKAGSQSGQSQQADADASDPFKFEDVDGPAFAADPILQVQVVLDRLGFSPGVIDGKDGQSFKLALAGFQKSRDLNGSGVLDEATKSALSEWSNTPATRLVRIPDGFSKGPFFPDLPKDLNDQAKLPTIGYRDLAEKLAERFHTKPEVIAWLNKGKPIAAGAVVRVPNIADVPFQKVEGDERGWGGTLAMLGVAADQPQADHIRVDKSDGALRVYDAKDRLIAQFPATMGSEHDPLPIGGWKIQGISRNPDFHYNPDLFWDAKAGDEKAVLKPGPNGPVGIVWIDISKPHYGIHGTPEPSLIGRTESHGCIRLTNWDAARLAQMVKAGIPAVFEP